MIILMTMNDLAEFQKSLGDNFEGNIGIYHKWLFFNSKTYTDINKMDSIKFSKQSKIKRCFDNCIKIAIRHPELKYIEGHVSCFGIPLEHAFLVNDNNEIIDPTLAISTNREVERYGDQYYGVEIPREVLIKYRHRENIYTPIPYLYWEEMNKK